MYHWLAYLQFVNTCRLNLAVREVLIVMRPASCSLQPAIQTVHATATENVPCRYRCDHAWDALSCSIGGYGLLPVIVYTAACNSNSSAR